MKLLAVLSGWSLISLEILLSSLQFPVWDAKSVVEESSGGEAIADKSVKVIKELESDPYSSTVNHSILVSWYISYLVDPSCLLL